MGIQNNYQTNLRKEHKEKEENAVIVKEQKCRCIKSQKHSGFDSFASFDPEFILGITVLCLEYGFKILINRELGIEQYR